MIILMTLVDDVITVVDYLITLVDDVITVVESPNLYPNWT